MQPKARPEVAAITAREFKDYTQSLLASLAKLAYEHQEPLLAHLIELALVEAGHGPDDSAPGQPQPIREIPPRRPNRIGREPADRQ